MTQQMIMLISSRRRWQSLFKAVCYGGIESSDLAKCFLQIIHRPIQKAFEECQKIIQLESDVSVLKLERRIKHAMSRRLLSKKHAAVQLTTKLLEEPSAKIVEIAHMQSLALRIAAIFIPPASQVQKPKDHGTWLVI